MAADLRADVLEQPLPLTHDPAAAEPVALAGDSASVAPSPPSANGTLSGAKADASTAAVSTEGDAAPIALSSEAQAAAPALTDFIDLTTLQDLQDAFAALTGVAVSIRDAASDTITHTSGESEFCLRLQGHSKAGEACRESHRTATDAACRSGRACRHECHAGLLQYAAPITVNGRHIAAIIVGDRPRTPLTDDQVHRISERFGLNYDSLRRSAWALQNWSDRAMNAAAHFAQLLANTLATLCYQEFELRRRVEELSALYRVTTMLSGEHSVKEVLTLSARLVTEVLHAKAAGIRLLDEETGELRIVAVHNLSDNYLNKGPLRVSDSEIDAAALAGQVVMIEDMPADPRTVYPEEARAEGIRSVLVCGLAYRGKSIGVMRVYSEQVRRFKSMEVALLRAVAGQAAAAIIHARMRRDAKEAEALERQVRLAGDVQRRMIPPAPPASPHLDIGCIYKPSYDLGGDFYDFLDLSGGHLGVAIADVVGKGVPASLTMASVRAALRAHARSIYDIDRIMIEVNRHLCRDTLLSEFVTLFYGVISADARRFTYCNAGHEPVVRVRGGRIERLDAGGLALGIEPLADYDRGVTDLVAGDTLLMLTDGVVEAMDYQGQPYGRERLCASLLRHIDLGAPQLAQQLLWDVRRFVGLAKQSDDMTLVVVKVR